MKLTVKAPKLYCVITGEKAVKVQEVVAAVVIMLVAALAVAFVPNLLNHSHGLRLAAVHFVDQYAVHLLAVVHPLRRYLKCLVKKVILAGDDVNKVSDAPWCMVGTIKVNVDFMQSFT